MRNPGEIKNEELRMKNQITLTTMAVGVPVFILNSSFLSAKKARRFAGPGDESQEERDYCKTT
jgi:hypothetical protein